MSDIKKPIQSPSLPDKSGAEALSEPSLAGIKLHLGAKCIECGAPVKVGNKFCKKTYCRNKNFWRRKLSVEIEDDVRADERKKMMELISSKMNGVMRVMFNFNDYINNLKEGK